MRDQEQLFFPQTSSVLPNGVFSVLLYHSSDLLSCIVLWSFHCFSLDSHVILYSSLVPSFLRGDTLVFCCWIPFPDLNFVRVHFVLLSEELSLIDQALLTAMWSPFIITVHFAFFQQSSSKHFFLCSHDLLLLCSAIS